MKATGKMIIIGLFIVISFYTMAAAVTTGAIEGLISNKQTGELIPKAKITLVFSKSASVQHIFYSDDKGHFYKGGMTPGAYKITVELDKFMPVQSSIRVRLGDTVKVDIPLMPFEGLTPSASKISTEASILLNEGKFEEAIEKLTEAMSEEPSNPLFYYYRGAAFEKTKNVEKALEDYQKSIELNPDFVLSISNIGKIYAKKKDFEKAIEFYGKAIELGDQDVITFYNYGVCLMNVTNQAEAKNIFEKLISLDEKYSDAYYQLGIIYIGLGNSAEAKELLQKFVEMDPENPNAQTARNIIESLNSP